MSSTQKSDKPIVPQKNVLAARLALPAGAELNRAVADALEYVGPSPRYSTDPACLPQLIELLHVRNQAWGVRWRANTMRKSSRYVLKMEVLDKYVRVCEVQAEIYNSVTPLCRVVCYAILVNHATRAEREEWVAHNVKS